MIPRLCKGLFEAIGASEGADKTSVSASYIEVSLMRKNHGCYSVGTPSFSFPWVPVETPYRGQSFEKSLQYQKNRKANAASLVTFRLEDGG